MESWNPFGKHIKLMNEWTSNNYYIVAEKPWEGSFNKMYVCMYVLYTEINVPIPKRV